jgi:hypothetical protein
MKTYGGDETLAPLILNGALDFVEWCVERICFSTPGERPTGTIKIS